MECYAVPGDVLFQSKHFDRISRGIAQIKRTGTVAVCFRLTKGGRITQQRKVRRMLLWKDKRDADFCKFEQSPGVILIDNFATKIFQVPIDSTLHIANRDCKAIDDVEYFDFLRCWHFYLSIITSGGR